MIKTGRIFLLPAVLLVNACSYIYGENGLIKDSSYDYLKAKQTSDLKIPEGLQHIDKIDYTVVPAATTSAAMGKALEVKAPVQVLDVLDNTRVMKNASVPTVLINDQPGFIWNTVQSFIEEHAIRILHQDKDKLQLETDWIPLDEDGVWLGIEGDEEADEFRARYQIRLIKGNLKDEFGLAVERTKAQWREDDDEPWQEKPSYWSDSAEMLNLLIGNYETQRNLKILARREQVMAGFRVELGQNAKGAPALITDAEPALVWEKLPKVFQDLGLKQVDKDVQEKTYYVEYAEQDSGFWASLFEDEKPKLPLDYGNYQVVLSAKGQQLAITWNDEEGKPLSSDIMVKLYPEMSKFFGDRR